MNLRRSLVALGQVAVLSRTSVLTAIAVLLAVPVVVRAGDSDKATASERSLLQAFREMPGMEAKFREEKRIALLREPLVNEGTVHFTRPGKFARHTLQPARSSLLVEGEILRMGTAKRHETLDARTQPLLRSFIDGYLGLMAGDLGALSKGYALAFEGKVDGAWTLTMKPKDPRLASLIESIAMTGTGTKVSRMVLRETSGDVSTTEFSEVNVAKTYDKAEEKRVFRLIE